jgi:hypothetical protein
LGIRGGGTEGRRRGYAGAQKCSSSKLNLDSDFLQFIVAQGVFSQPHFSQDNSARRSQISYTCFEPSERSGVQKSSLLKN